VAKRLVRMGSILNRHPLDEPEKACWGLGNKGILCIWLGKQKEEQIINYAIQII
jgi:hypothetical protein